MTAVGDIVRFTGNSTFCERKGMIGRVDCTLEDAAGEAAAVTEYLGTYRDGTHAFSIIGMVLPLAELEPATITLPATPSLVCVMITT